MIDQTKLYICSTFHHVYMTIIKTLLSGMKSDIVICDDVPNYRNLESALIKSQIFRYTYFFNRSTVREYKTENIIKKFLFQHKRNKSAIEIGFKLDLKRYQNIYIYHDGTMLGHYLMDTKTKYYLIEDGLDTFKTIKETPSKKFLPPDSKLKYFAKRILNIGYLSCGQSKYALSIEVNDKNGIVIPQNKVIECPKKELIDQLTKENLRKIYDIFVGKNEKFYSETDKTLLLLTQPLFGDKYVKSKEMHIKIYKDIISPYVREGYAIIIKPHPRDFMDYKANFSEAKIINKNIPTEVLNFNNEIHFNKAITITSSSVDTLKFAEEKIMLGLNFLKNYPDYLNDWVKECFK